MGRPLAYPEDWYRFQAYEKWCNGVQLDPLLNWLALREGKKPSRGDVLDTWYRAGLAVIQPAFADRCCPACGKTLLTKSGWFCGRCTRRRWWQKRRLAPYPRTYPLICMVCRKPSSSGSFVVHVSEGRPLPWDGSWVCADCSEGGSDDTGERV